ncbi:MAG: LPS export ABC transporter periplasmic protein LptC [Paracoccaceae bacterium]
MIKTDFHSRLIGWLKIVLPLLALVILSTLFLVARTINPDDALPYAEVDVEERLREPRMTAPTFAGLTNDGAALTVSADEARPSAAEGAGASATRLNGLLETPDGGRTELSAGAGRIDPAARQIQLSGGVTVASSTGWQVQGETLTADMDQTDVSLPTAVTATGPAGTVTADSMRLTQDAGRDGSYLLVFNGAVKLIYQPAN